MTADDARTGADGTGFGTGRGGNLEAVCFDLDDTLFDYTDYVRAGLREAAAVVEERTGHDLADELVALYFEEGVHEETFDRLIERHDLPAERLPVGDLVEAFHDSSGALTPYEEAMTVLSALEERGYDLGLITDGRNGRSKLRRLDLDDRFDAVFVGPEHGISKTDPTAFTRTLEELGVAPERAAYVGDNPHTDFRESNRLGMYTVRLRRGRYVERAPREDERPDAVVERLPDLLDLFGVDGGKEESATRG